MLLKSGQPEILRAAQRDDSFLLQFYENFTDIIQSILGIRQWMKYKEVFRVIPELVYYGLTTLSNLQTLGEEYTGILQTHSSGKSLQTKKVQMIMILLYTCGENVLIYTLQKFEKFIENLPEEHPLQPHARETLIQSSANLRNLIPFIQRLHKAVFYLNGEYYDVAKRLTSTRYMIIRNWLKDRSTLPAFQTLGIFSFVHLALYAYLTARKLKLNVTSKETKVLKDTSEGVAHVNKCPLCLGVRKGTSIISCGHLFCWDCIISWLQEQPQCPLCRKSVKPSRVVFLQNY